jgi:tRNA ligase
MAIVVRISDQEGQGWECINPIAHITVGTANDAIKPRESNDLLQKWNTEGTEGNGIHDIVFENKVFIEGTVSAVLSR